MGGILALGWSAPIINAVHKVYRFYPHNICLDQMLTFRKIKDLFQKCNKTRSVPLNIMTLGECLEGLASIIRTSFRLARFA